MPTNKHAKHIDMVILLALLALFLLASPFMHWWAKVGSPWFLPYLLWLLIIALAYLLQKRTGRHHV